MELCWEILELELWAEISTVVLTYKIDIMRYQWWEKSLMSSNHKYSSIFMVIQPRKMYLSMVQIISYKIETIYCVDYFQNWFPNKHKFFVITLVFLVFIGRKWPLEELLCWNNLKLSILIQFRHQHTLTDPPEIKLYSQRVHFNKWEQK